MQGFERKLVVGMLLIVLAFLPVLAVAMRAVAVVGPSEEELHSNYTRAVLQAETLRAQKSDTGLGMPKEQTDLIFDRCWQARDAAAQGNGLGSTISRAIVEAYDGTIVVQSTLGVDFTFTSALPMFNEPTPPQPNDPRLNVGLRLACRACSTNAALMEKVATAMLRSLQTLRR